MCREYPFKGHDPPHPFIISDIFHSDFTGNNAKDVNCDRFCPNLRITVTGFVGNHPNCDGNLIFDFCYSRKYTLETFN